MGKCALLLATVVFTFGVFGQSERPLTDSRSPGLIELSGIDDGNGQLTIDIRFQQILDAPIGAVHVFSEPSRTLLVRIVDEDMFCGEGLSNIRSQKATAELSTTLADFIEPRVSVAMPDPGDQRIRVEYIVPDGADTQTYTLCDVLLPAGLDKPFQFSVSPVVLGRSITTICGCNGVYCGEVTCPGVKMTLCCSICECFCGHIQCPRE